MIVDKIFTLVYKIISANHVIKVVNIVFLVTKIIIIIINKL
jgi:hypothetical protein